MPDDGPRRMTDAQLQALLAVADSGSFSQAARRLGTSQSAVSHAVTGLEQSLRVTLLRRSSQGAQLTDVGERVARHARQILHLRAQIEEEAESTRRMRTGALRVGSFGVSASRRMLPPLVEAFERSHPGIAVLVSEGVDDEVERWIRDGTVDVGFVTLPNDGLDTVAIAEDEMLVILREDHPLAGERSIRPSWLAGHPFIKPTAGCEPLLRDITMGVELDVRHRMREVDTIVGMVARGAGVSIKPALSIPDPLPAGVVVRPLEPKRTRRVALAVRRRDEESAPCLAFLRIAESAGAKVPGVRRAQRVASSE